MEKQYSAWSLPNNYGYKNPPFSFITKFVNQWSLIYYLNNWGSILQRLPPLRGKLERHNIEVELLNEAEKWLRHQCINETWDYKRYAKYNWKREWVTEYCKERNISLNQFTLTEKGINMKTVMNEGVDWV